MLRTNVAAVDSLGVRYRVAAAFSRVLDMPGLMPSGALPLNPSTTIPHLLQRLSSAMSPASGGGDPVARFEAELRQLMPLRDARIRQTPAPADAGGESVYFTVPTGSPDAPVLQVVFEPGQVPTEIEFRVLKAAAGLAAALVLSSERPSLEALTA